MWASAKESRSNVYIQPLQCRDVRNLSQWVKTVCYNSHLKLLWSTPHRLITHSPVRLIRVWYFIYMAALFCHISFLLIICISVYLWHVNELQCYLFDNCKLKKESSLFLLYYHLHVIPFDTCQNDAFLHGCCAFYSSVILLWHSALQKRIKCAQFKLHGE